MLDIINKGEYWEWLGQKLVKPLPRLKNIQDAFILSRLGSVSGCRLLEVGGGNSRVLQTLARQNECWNADKFEGAGAGPKSVPMFTHARIVRTFMGEFSDEIPDTYFDYVFSISVVEHIPTPALEDAFRDSVRVLKPGGQLIHAIDVYLFDADSEHAFRRRQQERIERYLDFAYRPDLGIALLEPPAIDSHVTFRGSYATNGDVTMYEWNKIAPALVDVRLAAQSASLKCVWVKA